MASLDWTGVGSVDGDLIKVKISELPKTEYAKSTDDIVLNQGGVTKRIGIGDLSSSSPISENNMRKWQVGLVVGSSSLVQYKKRILTYIGPTIPHTISGEAPESDGGLWDEENNPNGFWLDILTEYSDRVFWGKTLLRRKLTEVVSVQDFMTQEEIDDANSLTGNKDHSHAFTMALSKAKVVYVPPVKGQYRVGGVYVPTYSTLYGYSTVVYNGYADEHFNGLGSVIRLADGATTMFTFGHRCDLEGIIFDGRNNTVPMFSRVGTGQLSGTRAFKCGFYRFLTVGGPNGTYTGFMLNQCNINQNTTGIYNPIDSMIVNCTINANKTHGVNAQKGANNNTFIGVRNEWNLGCNYTFFQSTENTIIGELIDAAGLVGIALNSSTCTVVGVRIKRSGRRAFTGEIPNINDSAHFRLEGAGTKLNLSSVITEAGVDDAGGINTTLSSPQVVFRNTGSSSDMTLQSVGSTLTGFVTALTSTVVSISKVIVVGNTGMEDTITVGYAKVVEGERFFDRQTANLTQSVAASVNLIRPSVNTFSEKTNKVEVTVRDPSSGGRAVAYADILTYRESGNATTVLTNLTSYPTGSFKTDQTGIYNISVSQGSPDGSLVSVVVSSSSSGSKRLIITLK